MQLLSFFVYSPLVVKCEHRNEICCGHTLTRTHQILHHTHPLAAQLGHQAIDIHKVVISDVLDEVV